MKKVDYTHSLTEEDKIRIAFREKRGEIEDFTVQYSALINSRWRSIMRIDAHHGYAHQHTFHFRSTEHIVNLTSPGDRLNEVFTESSKHIKNNFEKIKRNYLNT